MASCPEKSWRLNNPILWGAVISTVFFLCMLFLAQRSDCSVTDQGAKECLSKWGQFLASSPNELGDTLAGLAGAMAFLWIIVTVWLQSHELSEQRHELQLTRQELQLTRKESTKMAASMEAQTNVFLEEQKQRIEARSDATVSAVIEEILYLATKDGLGNPKWERVQPESEIFMGEPSFRSLDFFPGDSLEIDFQFYRVFQVSLRYSISDIKNEIEIERIMSFPARPPELLDARHRLFTIIAEQSKCSAAMRSRLRKIKLTEAYELLDSFIRDEDFWSSSEVTTP